MPERNGYIPGVPCWVDASHSEPEAALDFYRGLFGWELEDVMPDGSEARYFIGRIRGGDVGALASIPPGAPLVPRWNTYIWVASADDAAVKAREAGGAVVAEPFDVLDSGRMAVLADPEGRFHKAPLANALDEGSKWLRRSGVGAQGVIAPVTPVATYRESRAVSPALRP